MSNTWNDGPWQISDNDPGFDGRPTFSIDVSPGLRPTAMAQHGSSEFRPGATLVLVAEEPTIEAPGALIIGLLSEDTTPDNPEDRDTPPDFEVATLMIHRWGTEKIVDAIRIACLLYGITETPTDDSIRKALGF